MIVGLLHFNYEEKAHEKLYRTMWIIFECKASVINSLGCPPSLTMETKVTLAVC